MNTLALPAIAVLGCLALDTLFGEPPERLHPVAGFGRAVEWLDREWPWPSAAGVVVALLAPLIAGVIGWSLTVLALWVHPIAGVAVAAIALFATTSLRRLEGTATDVIETSSRDLPAAREAAVALVGRDTSGLSASEVRSAALESASENLADGLVGPLLAFALGAALSLPVAVAAAIWVKAVNTLDSMVGYPSRPFGWASARLDDAVMWLPARIAAALIAIATRSPGSFPPEQNARHRPASPNSGWPMATLAGALDVRLRKPDAYVLNRDGDLPSLEAARTGVRVTWWAGLLAFVLAAGLATLAAALGRTLVRAADVSGPLAVARIAGVT